MTQDALAQLIAREGYKVFALIEPIDIDDGTYTKHLQQRQNLDIEFYCSAVGKAVGSFVEKLGFLRDGFRALYERESQPDEHEDRAYEALPFLAEMDDNGQAILGYLHAKSRKNKALERNADDVDQLFNNAEELANATFPYTDEQIGAVKYFATRSYRPFAHFYGFVCTLLEDATENIDEARVSDEEATEAQQRIEELQKLKTQTEGIQKEYDMHIGTYIGILIYGLLAVDKGREASFSNIFAMRQEHEGEREERLQDVLQRVRADIERDRLQDPPNDGPQRG